MLICISSLKEIYMREDKINILSLFLTSIILLFITIIFNEIIIGLIIAVIFSQLVLLLPKKSIKIIRMSDLKELSELIV